MPHVQIVYSANLEGVVDMCGLCEALRVEAARIEAFPMAGIRVRALRADYFSIADGDPKHGFIDLTVRIREGRSQPVKENAIKRVFNALEDFLKPTLQSRSIALSAELQEIDATLSPKSSTIRAHLSQAGS